MKKLWLAGLFLGLICAWVRAEGDTSEDGRVRLYIKAADPAGGKLTFRWEQVDGPPVKIADPAACKMIVEDGKNKYVSDTYYVPTEAGTYKFKITVTAEDGRETPKILSREVRLATAPPVAVAGKDKAVIAGQTVVLNGIDSKAAPGMNITEWEWKIVQAPPKFKLDERKLKDRQVDFKAEEPGVYQFELRVFDGKRWSESARLMVTVKANLPIIVEDADVSPVEIPSRVHVAPQPKQTVTALAYPGKTIKVGELILLDGSASQADPKLNPSFLWEQVQKGAEPLIKSLTPDRGKPFSKDRVDSLNYWVWTCRPEQPGDYTFVLRIEYKSEGTNETAKAESDPVVYKVLPAETIAAPAQKTLTAPLPGAAVEAKIVADKTEYEAGDMVKLDGSSSRVIEGKGKITDYVWGPVAGKLHPKNWGGVRGPKVEFRADEEGQYGVMLVVVSDTNERSQPAEISIQVGAANKAPVIELPKSYEGEPGTKIPLEAKITDPQNDRVEVKWTCIDPNNISIPAELAKNSKLIFVPKAPGTYLFKFVATNAKGRSAEAQTQVGVKAPGGQPPTAVIDGPKTAKIGAKVVLSGAKSASSPSGRTLTYNWSQVETEGAAAPKIPAEFLGDKGKVWEFTPTEPGRYIVGLVVSDGTLKSEQERFEFAVAAEAKPPVAKISGPASVKAGTPVVLSSADSSSPDGKELNAFRWTQARDGGPGIKLPSKAWREREFHFKPEQPGKYVLKLEVVDVDGNVSEPVAHTIEVKGINRPPNAVLEVLSKEPFTVGNEVVLSAHKSLDPQGAPLTFKWRQSAGSTLDLPAENVDKITVKPPAPGEYEFEVIVNNGDEDSVPIKKLFTVRAPNRLPVAVIAPITPCEPSEKITLDGTGSNDPDGDKLEYKWSLVSGPEVHFGLRGDTKPKVEITLPKDGEYLFELKVFDGKEWSTPVRAAVKTIPPSVAPLADAVSKVIKAEENEEVLLDGSPSHNQDNSTRPLKYIWKPMEKIEITCDGPDKPTAHFVPKKAGLYSFQLKVASGKVESQPVKVEVEVLKAGSLPKAVAVAAPLNGQLPIRVAQKNNPNDNNILVLNGDQSTVGSIAKEAALKLGKKADLTYKWCQEDGEDLGLKNAADLNKAHVGLRIFVPGIYHFSLTVNDGQNTSPKAKVEVRVVEDTGAENKK